MFSGKTNEDFYVLLVDVEVVVSSNNLIVEVCDGTSQLKPSRVCSDCVGDCFAPSTRTEGIGLELSVDSGDGERKFGDFRLNADDGSVGDLDGQPVYGWVDDAMLVESRLAVEDCSAERELRVQVDDVPVVGGKRVASVRSHEHELVGGTY